MAWMNMQIAVGLQRLGHDVYYMETTSSWPYDPIRQMKVDSADYAGPYLARVATSFGLRDRWAYRRSFADGEWLGMGRSRAEEILRTADAVFNVAGATRLAEEGLAVRRLVYLGTDPVIDEIRYHKGDPAVRALIDEHHDCVTYGENIGLPGCPIPPLPRLRARTRQPVLLDLWHAGPPTGDCFTTVGNWQQLGLDIEFRGETYRWSKHHEFLRFLDLPRRLSERGGPRIELAMNLAERREFRASGNEDVPAFGLAPAGCTLLSGCGFRLADAPAFTTDPWPYRDYIRASRGEFTVARDLHVRLRSGWFSERSACYLAAGRPVITQDTGFGVALPTGEGLFAFRTMDEALVAFDAICSDYARHSRAARELAEAHLRAETVLDRLLQDLSL
jgi:hypothetical protein